MSPALPAQACVAQGRLCFLSVCGWACLSVGYLRRCSAPDLEGPGSFSFPSEERLARQPSVSPLRSTTRFARHFAPRGHSVPQPRVSLPCSSSRLGGAGFSLAVPAAGGGAVAWAGGGRCLTRKGEELGRAGFGESESECAPAAAEAGSLSLGSDPPAGATGAQRGRSP